MGLDQSNYRFAPGLPPGWNTKNSLSHTPSGSPAPPPTMRPPEGKGAPLSLNFARVSQPVQRWSDGGCCLHARAPKALHGAQRHATEREFFIDNLLVRIHFIIVMISRHA